MVKLANGSQVELTQLLGGGFTDDKEKTLRFKQEKGTSTPSFIAKGTDGQIYGVPLSGVLVTVNVLPRPNYKQLRKEGRPIPEDRAEKIDKVLKEEKEREEKVATGEMSAEDAAKESEEQRKKEAKEEQEEIEQEAGEAEAEAGEGEEPEEEPESNPEPEPQPTTARSRRGGR